MSKRVCGFLMACVMIFSISWIFHSIVYASIDVCGEAGSILPDDYYRCFKATVPVSFVADKPQNALEIVEMWRPNNGNRRLELDPCHNENNSLDDTIFWLEEGYSTNYNENRLEAFTSSSIFSSFFFLNSGAITAFYGYYPDYVGSGRWGFCMDTHGMQVGEDIFLAYANENLWLRHPDRLYTPENMDLYLGVKKVTISWNGSNSAYVIYRRKVNTSETRYSLITGNTFFDDVECGQSYFYAISASSNFADFTNDNDYTFELYGGAHSEWSSPFLVRIGANCNGEIVNPNPDHTDPSFPATYTPTPASPPTLTPTPTVVPCLDHGNGAYLYEGFHKSGSCKYVAEGDTVNLGFSPKSVDLRGEGVNVNLCTEEEGGQPCSEINNDSDDLSWSSIFGNFISAKVRPGYTSNCNGGFLGIELYSEEEDSGSCWYLESGRYKTKFSPRSLNFLSKYMVIQLCKGDDGENPCSEWHDSQDSLSDSSIYGNFNSAIVAIEDPEIGDLQVTPLGWDSNGTKFYFRVQNANGQGIADVKVSFMDDPDLGHSFTSKTVRLYDDTLATVEFPTTASATCFYFTVDIDNVFAESNEANNYQISCKSGAHLHVPAYDDWLPEASLIVGDTYVFAPNSAIRIQPDYVGGWADTVQLISIPGHRPNGWVIATPFSRLDDIYPYSEAKRVEIINYLLLHCKGDIGCAEAQEFVVNEDGSIQKLVHTTLLNTPTPTNTLPPTATRVPGVWSWQDSIWLLEDVVISPVQCENSNTCLSWNMSVQGPAQPIKMQPVCDLDGAYWINGVEMYGLKAGVIYDQVVAFTARPCQPFTPTATASSTVTPTPSSTATATSTLEPTSTPSNTPISIPTIGTPTPSLTPEPSSTNTATVTWTPTTTPSYTPVATATATVVPSATIVPSSTSTSTLVPTPTNTITPSATATVTPTTAPTATTTVTVTPTGTTVSQWQNPVFLPLVTR